MDVTDNDDLASELVDVKERLAAAQRERDAAQREAKRQVDQ